ncbi:hypothetical protein PGT21_007188 [Puccinia graminis f. sp. tritici]|uniref:Uncharacterized protein n=1 Tax=Puccinia graminis f. sp. tritici TaxID=56615 RepID=A0A5B0N806_PUCGR|nr:hypothetical protein PGT21_007188 [Puccinia graminis f. sp. tritici]
MPSAEIDMTKSQISNDEETETNPYKRPTSQTQSTTVMINTHRCRRSRTKQASSL